MQKLMPCLWFDDQLEEAIAFYSEIFPDAEILQTVRHDDGRLFVAVFRLADQTFQALNGGPHFTFNEAVSFTIACRDQAEVDHYWQKLLDGGAPRQCGWLKDRYGLFWQVVPEILPRAMQDPDRERAGRVRDAMMKMIKLDVAELERAWHG
ncbi:VOC family protein [Pararhizobium haloflavum]|uniref:VOC family protein n=1 Tax=Pararhizobium haloflavum TaxID=2037914 RepID=UPI000C1783FF|nr:VOC family protein [Pararhizobium haloflavum]